MPLNEVIKRRWGRSKARNDAKHPPGIGRFYQLVENGLPPTRKWPGMGLEKRPKHTNAPNPRTRLSSFLSAPSSQLPPRAPSAPQAPKPLKLPNPPQAPQAPASPASPESCASMRSKLHYIASQTSFRGSLWLGSSCWHRGGLLPLQELCLH